MAEHLDNPYECIRNSECRLQPVIWQNLSLTHHAVVENWRLSTKDGKLKHVRSCSFGSSSSSFAGKLGGFRRLNPPDTSKTSGNNSPGLQVKVAGLYPFSAASVNDVWSTHAFGAFHCPSFNLGTSKNQMEWKLNYAACLSVVWDLLSVLFSKTDRTQKKF